MKRLVAYLWGHLPVVALVLFLLFLAGNFVRTTWFGDPGPVKTDLSVVRTMIDNKEIKSATIVDKPRIIQVQPADGRRVREATFATEGADELVEQLERSNVDYEVVNDNRGILGRNIGLVASTLAPVVIMLTLFWFVLPRLLGRGAIGKTDFRSDRPKERFTDVKGADEAIAELQLYVNYLANPGKHKGLRLARGILLHGPTGTGKTLLAMALAGEAGVPFHHLSGSGLTSMWGGATTERIQQFFNKLKKELGQQRDRPAVVFIDELEGIASKRAGTQGVDRDTNTSVTELLHQLGDLFTNYPSVVVIAATNNPDKIDDAIKRPGRLGKHIAMPNPDQRAREHILAENSTHLTLRGIDLRGIAQLTGGLSGAVVAEVPHEAQRLAVMREGRLVTEVTRPDFERAAMQVVMGMLRDSATVSPKNARIAAAHESGHSVLAYASPHHELLVATVIPIDESGGSTWCPMKDYGILTEEIILWRLAVNMGGREAEKLDLGQASSGCAHDTEGATNLALHAVCRWSIYDDFLPSVNLDNWQSHPNAVKIGKKVEALLQEAREKARRVLIEHRTFRVRLQEELLAKRILHSDELTAMAAATAPADRPTQ